MKDKIHIFSFFSGAGFLDLGFELSGAFDVVYVNEFHKAFNDVYKYARSKMGIAEPKYGHHVEDITAIIGSPELDELKSQVSESKAEHLTGIIGGPPCPDFSVAGKNKGMEGENGKLSGTYVSLICETLPDFFLFENVKGLYRTAKHREFFEHLNTALEDTPFKIAYRVQNELMLYFYEFWKENGDAEWHDILNESVDQILMMKVLPCVEGDEDLLEKPFASLAKFCATGNYRKAAQKVA